MKDSPRHWIAEKVTRRQPPLGTHEPNKPEMCYAGEVGGHFQDIIKVPSGVIFEAPEVQEMMRANKEPISDELRLQRAREELQLIAESAKYSGNGEEI
jgi:hypothetical protein